MSKYSSLWQYVADSNQDELICSFEEIYQITHVEIDHSFLNFKKELLQYGYQVKKISIKNQTVTFSRIKEV